MKISRSIGQFDGASQASCYLGAPSKHRLASVINEAMCEPMFSTQWDMLSDASFRPYAVAVLELSNAKRMALSSRSALYRELCLRKRIDVLSEVVGKPIPARVLKYLSRADWVQFTGRDWKTFISIALEDSNSRLGHVPLITRVLVRQFAMIPAELRLPGLMTVFSNLEVPAERWLKLQGFINKAKVTLRAELLRDAGNMKSNGDFWDFYFRCEGKDKLPFSIPEAMNESYLLEPIRSPNRMVAEGIKMNNCLEARISRVLSGSRIYFKMRGCTSVNTELVKSGQIWIPGDILGWGNSAISPELTQSIRAELCRLAKSIPVMEEVASDDVDSYLANLRREVVDSFSDKDFAWLTTPLQTIQAKSNSGSDGAYAIFETKRGGYVQFMSSPDGKEFLLEISSHNYVDNVNVLLTADKVELIEKAGFVWPAGKGNFIRWFNTTTQEDIQAMAEVALAILVGIFGYRSNDVVRVTTHIPACPVEHPFSIGEI